MQLNQQLWLDSVKNEIALMYIRVSEASLDAQIYPQQSGQFVKEASTYLTERLNTLGKLLTENPWT